MSTQATIEGFVQDILDHKRETAARCERIRRDPDISDEERPGSLSRAHQVATARHNQLVDAMRALAERGDDEGDGTRGENQKPQTMNDVIRASRDAARFDPGFAERILLSPPERPSEVPAR